MLLNTVSEMSFYSEQAEKQSLDYLLAALVMFPLALLWFVLPSDLEAAVGHFVFKQVHKPHGHLASLSPDGARSR